MLALATELALGVLRQQRLLDFLIERQSRKRIAALDREVVLALRLGLYQLRFLDRVPARAAIFESVELVKHGRKKSAATFVNAVLRGASENARADVAALLPPEFPAGRATRNSPFASHVARRTMARAIRRTSAHLRCSKQIIARRNSPA